MLKGFFYRFYPKSSFFSQKNFHKHNLFFIKKADYFFYQKIRFFLSKNLFFFFLAILMLTNFRHYFYINLIFIPTKIQVRILIFLHFSNLGYFTIESRFIRQSNRPRFL